tara:strand:- start:2744 stop:3409 length:666 start_codon:yes stop_codon:yes gene_type:complete
MKISNFVFNDLRTKKQKNDFIEFLRHQTNAEFGGYRMFDGTRTHLMHVPEELCELISFLKISEKNSGQKFSNFLEIGYSSGKANTIFNKFFNFKRIVAIDDFTAEMSSTDLLANLMRKNLTLICGSSYNKNNQKIINDFGPYDLIFVDASHEYKDVKKDLNNYSKLLKSGGILIAHDIDSLEYNGVKKAWNEFKKSKNFSFKEIVCKKYFFVCGFGIAIKK